MTDDSIFSIRYNDYICIYMIITNSGIITVHTMTRYTLPVSLAGMVLPGTIANQ